MNSSTQSTRGLTDLPAEIIIIIVELLVGKGANANMRAYGDGRSTVHRILDYIQRGSCILCRDRGKIANLSERRKSERELLETLLVTPKNLHTRPGYDLEDEFGRTPLDLLYYPGDARAEYLSQFTAQRVLPYWEKGRETLDDLRHFRGCPQKLVRFADFGLAVMSRQEHSQAVAHLFS